jgi:hypothetical protein
MVPQRKDMGNNLFLFLMEELGELEELALVDLEAVVPQELVMLPVVVADILVVVAVVYKLVRVMIWVMVALVVAILQQHMHLQR